MAEFVTTPVLRHKSFDAVMSEMVLWRERAVRR